jgi:ArsR family transcriptional regulator
MGRKRKGPAPRSEAALEAIARRFKALGDPLRLRVLYVLRGGERTVGEIAQEVDASHSNVSRHLSLLANQGILARKQSGNQVYYSIADPSVLEICEAVCGDIEERLERQRRTLG